ncbi:FAD binding domain-containing protein [Desertibaculum subflavum]|uniref:FAD binding domain-containing protein n=1 Tax=Desertibaculum subflavum TaxID=2268458 RepID=UPI000E675A48
MHAFDYARATEPSQALDLARRPDAAFIAGGTDLLQLWKAGIARPELMIDISRLALDIVKPRDDGIAIGALARLSDVADHPIVQARWPLIAEALNAGASAQVRNAATIGGNLLQRTRCAYFRSGDMPCNKRAPGSGCPAIGGENRSHAIFGGSPHCVATHASDLAVALAALDASVRVAGPAGSRLVGIGDFYLLPGDTPQRETVLGQGQLICAVDVPATAGRAAYVKVRDRASFEFAVVSVAADLVIDDGIVARARLAAGGVGTRPWRLTEAEAALIGERADAAAFDKAAAQASNGAEPLAHNAFKVELLRRTVRRALQVAGGKA